MKKDYSKMTAAQLEAEANKLLFGAKEEPKRMSGEQYQKPKHTRKWATCEKCGKPRNHFGAALCYTCYRKRIRKKDTTFAAEYYEEQRSVSGFENGGLVRTVNPFDIAETAAEETSDLATKSYRWSAEEIQRFEILFTNGYVEREISEVLQRSPSVVHRRIVKIKQCSPQIYAVHVANKAKREDLRKATTRRAQWSLGRKEIAKRQIAARNEAIFERVKCNPNLLADIAKEFELSDYGIKAVLGGFFIELLQRVAQGKASDDGA